LISTEVKTSAIDDPQTCQYPFLSFQQTQKLNGTPIVVSQQPTPIVVPQQQQFQQYQILKIGNQQIQIPSAQIILQQKSIQQQANHVSGSKYTESGECRMTLGHKCPKIVSDELLGEAKPSQ
jgi:hypothetical protein